jgi:hypothetical protein
MYTVRLCRDSTGWFATMSDELADYPGVCTHWEEPFQSPDDAMRGLDLAQSLAYRLEGEALWSPQTAPLSLLDASLRAEAPIPAPQHPTPLAQARSAAG